MEESLSIPTSPAKSSKPSSQGSIAAWATVFWRESTLQALVIELRRMGLKVEEQVRILVFYDGIVVGEYYADLVVEDLVIVECKAIKQIDDDDKAQLLNYLRARRLTRSACC